MLKRLRHADSTQAEASGYIVYETIFGRKRFDFDKVKKIAVPIPPRIEVVRVEKRDFSFKDKKLEALAVVKIINDSKSIDLEISDINYELSIEDQLHTSGKYLKIVRIKPQSSVTLEIPLSIDVYHPFKTLWLVKTNRDKLNYTFELTANARENISERSYKTPAKISASGKMELVK